MRRISAHSVSVSYNQSSFIVPASGIQVCFQGTVSARQLLFYSQDLASFSRVTAVEDEDGPRDDSSLHTANIVIIGDKTVGKTSIARVRRD